MNFKLIRKLSSKPMLYEKGSSVMWTDPYISKQLLELHINPDHDIASRNKSKIDNITNWILAQTNKTKLNILDLGCGPGLYAERMAQKGHTVTGIDFSENSIQYATKLAKEKHLDIKYIKQNYLDLNFDNQFDLIILIYLDFCVLMPEERDRVLENIYRALKKDGLFICDIVNQRNIDKKIIPQSWDIQEKGFWKETPYIALTNGYHYPEAKVLANHHIIIGEDNSIDTYIFWTHYYETDDLYKIFEENGFANIKHFENVLPDNNDYWNGDNVTFYVVKK